MFLQYPVCVAENLRKEFTKHKSSKRTKSTAKHTKDKVKVAVRNVTFAVQAGEVFGLLGPNGAGKTTALNMMTADIVPTRGKIKIDWWVLRMTIRSEYILTSKFKI